MYFFVPPRLLLSHWAVSYQLSLGCLVAGGVVAPPPLSLRWHSHRMPVCGVGVCIFGFAVPLVPGSVSALVTLEGADGCLDDFSVFARLLLGLPVVFRAPVQIARWCLLHQWGRLLSGSVFVGPRDFSWAVSHLFIAAVSLPGSLVPMAICLYRYMPSPVRFPLSVPAFGSWAHDGGLLGWICLPLTPIGCFRVFARMFGVLWFGRLLHSPFRGLRVFFLLSRRSSRGCFGDLGRSGAVCS